MSVPKLQPSGSAPRLPSRSKLAVIAALASGGMQKPPADAVAYAMQLWKEAGSTLERNESAHADEQRRFAEVPLPRQFPATLREFLSQVVRSKTPSDSVRLFRGFLKFQAREAIEQKGLRAPEAEEVDRIAAFHLQAWQDGGFSTAFQWRVTAKEFADWQRQRRSKTNRQNALMRQRKPPRLPSFKKSC